MITSPATPNPVQASVAAAVTPPVVTPASLAVATPQAPPVVATPPAAGTPTAAAPVAAPAAVAAPVDPRTEINDLATSFGYSPESFSHFPDAATARAAIRWQAQQFMHAGAGADPHDQKPQQPAYQPQYPGVQAPIAPLAPAAPAAGIVDLKALGLEEDEPAAKAIRKLEEKIAAGGAPTAALIARLDAIESATKQENTTRRRAEADAIIDGFASPTYGVGARRTAYQQFAIKQLYDVADAIYLGAVNSGRPAPSLQQRLLLAREVHDPASQVSQLATNAAAVVPGVPAVRAASPAPAPAAVAVPMNEKWSQNPHMQALLGLPG